MYQIKTQGISRRHERLVIPKPLDKWIYKISESAQRDHVEELLAAIAFWREAVKSLPEHRGGFCLLCNNGDGEMTLREGGEHKPDCAWLLAQERE